MRTFNSDLIDDVARRRVVLFLGAGVTSGAKFRSASAIRQWGSFLESVASKMSDVKVRAFVKKLLKKEDYLIACEMIRASMSSEDWLKELKDEYSKAADISDLHKAIIGLDQRIIVTTNFDKLIESAWNEVNKSATHYPNVVYKIDESIFYSLRNNEKYIIKIHGSVDDPTSIIFSHSDYYKSAYGNWFYSRYIETLLSTHTFVFVGFSMKDPAISSIVESYAQKFPQSRPHYMFLSEKLPDAYVEASKKLRRLFLIPYDSRDNHAELTRLIASLSDVAGNRRREILVKEQALLSDGG